MKNISMVKASNSSNVIPIIMAVVESSKHDKINDDEKVKERSMVDY